LRRYKFIVWCKFIGLVIQILNFHFDFLVQKYQGLIIIRWSNLTGLRYAFTLTNHSSWASLAFFSQNRTMFSKRRRCARFGGCTWTRSPEGAHRCRCPGKKIRVNTILQNFIIIKFIIGFSKIAKPIPCRTFTSHPQYNLSSKTVLI